MTIRQTAGDCRIEVTAPSPRWVRIEVIQRNGVTITADTDVAALHDLRYCIDRVLAHVTAEDGA